MKALHQRGLMGKWGEIEVEEERVDLQQKHKLGQRSGMLRGMCLETRGVDRYDRVLIKLG